MSLRCRLGRHDHPVADRAADGRQVLRCPRCWRVSDYPATDAARVAVLRAGQQQQAEQIQRQAIARSWKQLVRVR